MNHEPEGTLTSEELLRAENIQLKRQLLSNADTMLIHDIARARLLNVDEYGKTWTINNGRIEQIQPALAETVEAVG